jgi:hypothetical protein
MLLDMTMRRIAMPNVEANNKNCHSNMEGNVCAVDKLQVKQNKQTKNNNEEFASEILGAGLKNESKNTFGNETEKRPESERTPWN